MIRRYLEQIFERLYFRSNLFFKIYVRLFWRPRKDSVQEVLDAYSKCTERITFVQVGSNDGYSGDPLYTFIRRDRWQGVLVEPVRYLFEKLKYSYKGLKQEDLNFENVAISNHVGYQNFYSIDEFTASEKTPGWLSQLSSFNQDFVNKIKFHYPSVAVSTTTVKCETIESITQKYGLKRLNVLHIDAEGYDYEIIKTINFERIRPEIILYEHQHLNESDANECYDLLMNNGYKTVRFEHDTLALSGESMKRITGMFPIESERKQRKSAHLGVLSEQKANENVQLTSVCYQYM